MDQIMGNIGLLFEYPIVNVKIILDGIMAGALFALVAYGLALVWGVMNVKNLAQGDFVIAGGYVSWYLWKNIGLHPLLGVPAAFIVLWGIGWLTYKLVISRVIERDLFTSLLATFGLAIMFAQLLNLMFGSDTQSVTLDLPVLEFANGFIQLPMAKVLGVAMAGVLATAVILFMKNSRMGQAILGTAQDARPARVLGSETEKVYAFTYVPGFFEKLGFHVVQHQELPHKMFNDCKNCPKFTACDEIAMIRVLREPTEAEREAGSSLPSRPIRIG